MSQPSTPVGFDEQQAAAYDDRFAPIAAIRDALHLQMRAILSVLPASAQVLCVGAGTGAELSALAGHFPQWRFTVVEPSPPMMNVCRRKATDQGFANRCTFHTGYVDSLPAALRGFDAVTSLLVSHFITDRTARLHYYRQIAHRLSPGGWFINADLSGDQASPEHARLEDAWFRLMAFTGQPADQRATTVAAWQKNVAFLRAPEIESLLIEAGFEGPTLFHQALLIRAWFARRSA